MVRRWHRRCRRRLPDYRLHMPFLLSVAVMGRRLCRKRGLDRLLQYKCCECCRERGIWPLGGRLFVKLRDNVIHQYMSHYPPRQRRWPNRVVSFTTFPNGALLNCMAGYRDGAFAIAQRYRCHERRPLPVEGARSKYDGQLALDLFHLGLQPRHVR